MTLQEAMVDLSIQREVKHRLGEEYQANALGLGIEGLKLIKALRHKEYRPAGYLMPGETKGD